MVQKYVIPHKGKLNKEDRRKLKGHKSCIIWFTGLSGSGKSTIAHALEEELYKRGIHTYILDGDNIRTGLNKDLGFSEEDRKENIRRIGEVAKLFVDAGIIVLVAAISPYKRDREFVRNLVEPGEFIEVYVKCPLEVCEMRDPKGLYKKARQGLIKNFTGIDDPYEEPENPEILIESHRESVPQAVNKILKFLESKGIIPTEEVEKE
jgi:adenylylsulfate kinase